MRERGNEKTDKVKCKVRVKRKKGREREREKGGKRRAIGLNVK